MSELVATRLPLFKKLSYGVGHYMNDLCASIWFSYLLIFFHQVIEFSNEMAGYLMLLGQVADAICTPFVGLESDRRDGFHNYGKRKSWHALGCVCVAISFPFLFMPALGASKSSDWAQFIYYAPFVVIFQFGWATTQISHLSLIPDLTSDAAERIELNSIRYAFTILANLSVYLTAWLLLDLHMSSSVRSHELTAADAPLFRIMALSAVGFGLLFCFLFHIFVKEPSHEHKPCCGSSQELSLRMSWRDWLKEPQFYIVAMLYMNTRLVVNLSQIYLPMYLTETLKLDKKYIAIMPLFVFLFGFLVSILMRPLGKLVGMKMTYLIGVLLLAASFVGFWFKPGPSSEIFAACGALGAGSSAILITSLTLTAQLIGENTESAAFVYGAMSFTDKLSNGVAVVFIQQFHPCKLQACCSACVWYYRNAVSLIPGAILTVAFLSLLFLCPLKVGQLRKFKDYSPLHDSGGERVDTNPEVLDFPTHSPLILPVSPNDDDGNDDGNDDGDDDNGDDDNGDDGSNNVDDDQAYMDKIL